MMWLAVALDRAINSKRREARADIWVPLAGLAAPDGLIGDGVQGFVTVLLRQ